MPFKNRLRKNDVNFCLHAIVWPFCVRYLSNIEKKSQLSLFSFDTVVQPRLTELFNQLISRS